MPSTFRFIDHGIPVPNAAENRSAVLTRDQDGRCRLVLFSTGFLLNVDLNAMKAVQVPYPEGSQGSPFGSYCARNGMVYSGAGPLFMAFDAIASRFVFHARVPDVQVAAWCCAEDEHGRILFGSYATPSCRLFRYDPSARQIESYGQMDPYGAYLDHLAVDAGGWVYLGVGTEKKGILAFHPATGERRTLTDDRERTRGSAWIHRGRDGRVYGHTALADVGWGFTEDDLNPDLSWLRLSDGCAEPVACREVALPDYYHARHTFLAIHSPFCDASFIREYDLGHRELKFRHPATGQDVTLPLDYCNAGAALSPMVGGLDGKLHGTSNHPMHGYTYDPHTKRLTDLGGRFYQESGGGNICAYAVHGSVIGGAAYYGGKIHILDTSKPYCLDGGPSGTARNPRLVATHKEILRPRCAAAHVDGETFIFGGFGENGGTGGGLCIYNIKTGVEIVLQNQDLLKYHSTLCMRVLANGDLVAGTSTDSPCGGTAKVPEAELYILDWESKTIRYRCVPVPGNPEIALMELDDRGLVHGITSGRVYFVFDSGKKRVLHRQLLPEDFGHVVRDGLLKGPDRLLYGLCSRAIYTINPEDFMARKLIEPLVPVGSGMALLAGRIYFSGTGDDNPSGCPTHLWSYELVAENRSENSGKAKS